LKTAYGSDPIVYGRKLADNGHTDARDVKDLVETDDVDLMYSLVNKGLIAMLGHNS
jgi:hypothetical protein